MKFGQDFQAETLSVGVMIYLYDEDQALPDFPASSTTALGCKRDDGSPLAHAWVDRESTCILLHRYRMVSDAEEQRIGVLKKVMAPYWFSTWYPLPCPDDKRAAA